MNIHKQFYVLIALAGLAATTAQADTVRRISQRDGPVLQGNENSREPKISANGNYVVFFSNAANLPPIGPAFGGPMILVKNLITGSISWKSQRGDFESPPLNNPRSMVKITEKMCVDNSGRPYWENLGDNDTGVEPCPDNNFSTDIYFNGSYSPTFSSTPGILCGLPSNGDSGNPAIAWDGSKVAFESNATNFGPADTNGKRDIYMRTTPTGAIVKVSSGVGGAAANNDSFEPSVSSGGTFVAYSSNATNIVAGDSNGVADVFVASLGGAPTTERVSVFGATGQANGNSYSPAISADGRYVTFTSMATNLVPGDTNGVTDIFVRDRTSGITSRISMGAGGAQANGFSDEPVISGDGRYIAYYSVATNLVLGDSNNQSDVFLYDRNTATTTRISVTSTFGQANDASYAPSISADGRRIVFTSEATNIVPGDTNGKLDVFMYTITAPPANDTCAGAVAIGLGNTAGSTISATADGVSSCSAVATNPDVYYTFTPTRSAYVRFETVTSNYDPILSLHTACPATLINQIACDDDSGGNGLALIASQFVTSGVPITVRVSGFGGLTGDFTLRLSEVAPPNDLCASPVILALNTPIIGTNVASGNEGSATCQANSARDVFYAFTPTCTADYTFATTGSLDTVVSVHTACPATANNSIGCDDDSGPGTASLLTVGLNANTTYWIRVAGFGGAQSGFGFSVTNNDGLNDECVVAMSVAAGQHPFNNCAATPIGSSLSICGTTASHDLWYTYTSTDSDLPITIATVGFDTVLAVYNGCPGSGGTQLACNDDFAPPLRGSLVRVSATAGTTLIIQVAGFSTNSGAGTLSIGQCLADLASSEGPFPDGIVDGNDFVAFINSFGIGDPAASPVADVNGDGIIDGNDFVAFINAFAAGC